MCKLSPQHIEIVLFPDSPLSHNCLVNQVKFLGLVHTLWHCHLATFKTFYAKPTQKGTDTRVEIKKIYCCKHFQCRNLIGPYHFWEISPRIQVCSPDCFSPGGACELGTILSINQTRLFVLWLSGSETRFSMSPHGVWFFFFSWWQYGETTSGNSDSAQKWKPVCIQG